MQPLEQDLLKFSHCSRDIYCSRIPQLCPVCGQSAVSSWSLQDAPISIPTPFQNGHREKCCFLLKPTAGLFGDYDGCSDLHVGISSTSGLVFHYNETGIHSDDAGWEQCVCVPLVPPDYYALINQWDSYLQDFVATDTWLPPRYNEEDHNCYTFALQFINGIQTLQEKPSFSKTEFTERFVLPRTKRVSKYMTVLREVTYNGFYIVGKQ
uniref:MKRN2 opposite strand n=1 Tax=Leptobrachium leishanense TaxID=445787 RepID=A0A8C5QW02_9ANUR